LFLALIVILPALALTNNWDFSTGGDYTYDTAKIEVASGLARLKTTFFDLNWSYRQAITIDNTASSSNLSEYQVEVNIDNSNTSFWNNVKSDGSDIRLADSDGTTLLDFYLDIFDYSGQSATIWVQTNTIEALSSRTIYLYYGNAAATSASSIEATFSYSTLRTVAYVVSNILAANTLNVVSLMDGNQIYDGTSTLILNDQQTGSFAAAELSQGTAIQATGLFHADSAAQTTDMLSPISFAGTEFTYYCYRNSDVFCIVSPFGTASVRLYDNGVEVGGSPYSVSASGTTISQNITDGRVVRITSDIPVLVQHYADTYDSGVYYPATTDNLYGVPSSRFELGAGPSGASADWRSSTPGSGTIVLGANGGNDTSGLPSQGAGPAYLVSANNPIGANGLADGDGGEFMTFLPQKELGTVFGSANTVEYIAVAAPYASTICTLYNNLGVQVAQQTGGTDAYVNKVYFTNVLSGGWKLVTSQPVFAYYEKDAVDDETNLMSYKQMRQLTYPAPSVSLSGVELTHYAADDPTIQPAVSNFVFFTSLASFEETATKNGGEIKYILSNDQGISWYYYSSGWISSNGTYSQANTASEVNSNITTLPVGDGKLLFKAFLHSDGTQLVQLDQISLGYSIAPGVAEVVHLTAQPNAGDTSVWLKAAFDEDNPDQNLFYAAFNGGDYGSSTVGQSDTDDPATQEVDAESTLDGNDYINKIRCIHVNDTGIMTTNESTSPNVAYKFVKPYKPSQLTANNATASTVDVAVNKNPAETGGLEYAIYVPAQAKYVQADGSLASSAVWQTISSWGTTTVTGLSSPESTIFRVKSRNTSDADNLPYSESALSLSVAAGGPVVPDQILSYAPSADAVGVSVESTIQINFDRDMDTSSVQNNFSLVELFDNQGSNLDADASGTFSWVGNRQVVFTPTSDLKNGYTYQVLLSQEAQDVSGEVMSSELAWNFYTLIDHSATNVFWSSDAKAQIILSPEALTADMSIIINRDPSEDPTEVDPNSITLANNKITAEGNIYKYPLSSTATEFNVYNAAGDRITDFFSSEVIVTLYYLDENNDGFVDNTSPRLQERGLVMCRLDETNSLWVEVPGSTVNTEHNYVQARVPHFSVYILMGTPALSVADAYSFPNPFKPSEGHTTITFTNLSSISTVKIYTLTGQLVRTIIENDGDAQVTWDVKNSAGEDVVSGLYLYVVKSADDIKRGKLVVIR